MGELVHDWWPLRTFYLTARLWFQAWLIRSLLFCSGIVFVHSGETKPLFAKDRFDPPPETSRHMHSHKPHG